MAETDIVKEAAAGLDAAAEVITIMIQRENVYRDGLLWIMGNSKDEAMVRFAKSKLQQVDKNHPLPKGVA